MKKLYILCGLAFSGKSTLAKRIVEHKQAILVSQDVIWFENKEKLNLDLDSDEDWERIQKLSREEIRKLLADGNSVVYDDISLTKADRDLLRALAVECGADAVVIYLDTPKGLRDQRQKINLETGERHDVPEHILEWGQSLLELPKEDEHPIIFTPETNEKQWLGRLP